MATKKYLSLERLKEYDGLIKGVIEAGDDATLESANSYTDTKVSNITSGTIVVKEAEHADSADEATHAGSAGHSETADSATKATQDGNGNVIASTYETKVDAANKLTESKTYTDTEIAKKADKTHNHEISDVTNLQTSLDQKVSNTITINGKALSDNITLTANDVGAYSKIEIDNMELITEDDINAICGGTIVAASEVTF